MNRSIYIYSKKNLNSSLQNIESLFNFLRNNEDTEIIYSDNSKDEKKFNFFLKKNEKNFIYCKSPYSIDSLNYLDCIKKTRGEFICSLNEDNKISILSDASNHSDLKNVIGFRPNILNVNENGIKEFSNFSIESKQPIDRIIEYSKKNKANNNTFLSFFKKEIVLPTMELTLKYHPFKEVGYFDWAIVLFYVTQGFIIQEKNLMIINNNFTNLNSNLGNQPLKQDDFSIAGFDEELNKYFLLLLAYDCYIYIIQNNSILDINIKKNIAENVMQNFLNQFLLGLKNNINLLNLEEVKIINKISTCKNINDYFLNLFSILELFAPGVAENYNDFLFYATGNKV